MKRSKSINLESMRKSDVFCDASADACGNVESQKKVESLNNISALRRPLGVAVVASFSLAGCSSDSEEAAVYRSVEDCKDSNPGQAEACQIAYENAEKEAERTAPKYSSQRDCEDEFGYDRCRRHSSSGVFMPMMAGYMIGSMLNGGRYSYNPMFTSYSRHSPYYGNWVGAGGRDYGSRYNSSVRARSGDFQKKPTVTKTMSRGGFGSRAAAASSWSGSRSSGWGG